MLDNVPDFGVDVYVRGVYGTEVADVRPVGKWKLSTDAGSMGVGPYEFDVSWWNGDGVILRCFYDDEYLIKADGTFELDLQNETWVEQWQGGTTRTMGLLRHTTVQLTPRGGSPKMEP